MVGGAAAFMAAEPGLAVQHEPQMAQLTGAFGPANEQPLLGQLGQFGQLDQQEVMAVNAEVDVQTATDVAH